VLVLASRSPQRRAILEQLGIPFEVVPADVEEDTDGPPAAVVCDNALRKAQAVAVKRSGRVVLAVDTAVVLDGGLYGKAGSEAEARAHLRLLSGRVHQVWSGLALVGPGADRGRVQHACTAVEFRELDERMVDWYLLSGEWRERAGSYAIQGRGAALVRRIEGDFWNVVGLPVGLLLQMTPTLLG
jgi:septum formation protein